MGGTAFDAHRGLVAVYGGNGFGCPACFNQNCDETLEYRRAP